MFRDEIDDGISFVLLLLICDMLPIYNKFCFVSVCMYYVYWLDSLSKTKLEYWIGLDWVENFEISWETSAIEK